MKDKHILTPYERELLWTIVKEHGVTKTRKLFGVSAVTLDKAFFCGDGVQVNGWNKETHEHIVQQIKRHGWRFPPKD